MDEFSDPKAIFSSAYQNPKETLPVLAMPAVHFCTECSWALYQDTPQGWQPRASTPAILTCRNPSCNRYGVRLRSPFTIVHCEVVK